MSRFYEFFEDHTGHMSMTRLLVFLAFAVAAPITAMIGTEEALGIFLGAFVVNYAAGKISDAFGKESGDGMDTK